MQTVTVAMKQKMLAPWKESYDKPRQHVKNRDITLPTKVHIVKAMLFPAFMYGCEGWTTKTTLRVLWTARISNRSILKKIYSKYSLEGLILNLKLQYSGHLIPTADSLEDPDAGKDSRQKEK